MTSSILTLPLSSADALTSGDTLIANRHTCVLESSDPKCNGLEIDDHWCNYTDGTDVEKAFEMIRSVSWDTGV